MNKEIAVQSINQKIIFFLQRERKKEKIEEKKIRNWNVRKICE